MTGLTVTDACTLPSSDRPRRLAEFDALFASSADSVVLDDAGLRILLSGTSGLRERVRDLTEREAACCSFFSFAIEGTDEALTLRVSVPQERRDLLGTLAARAQELSVTNGASA